VKKSIAFQLILLVSILSLGAKNQDINTLKEPTSPIKNATKTKKSTEELSTVKAEAEPIIDTILTALNEKNHAKYTKDFNGSMKSAYPNDVFMKTHDFLTSRLGRYISREFFKINKMNQHYIVFYRAKFSKAQDSVVVRLVLERIDNQLKVVFLSYNSPLLQDTGQKKQ
jgi:hypothetical protein